MTMIQKTSVMRRLPMSRRRLLATALAGVVGLAACGSDADTGGPSDTADPEPSETLPPATTHDEDDGDVAGGDVEGAPTDGAILEIGYYGGFTPIEFAFQMQPALLVAADGTVLFPAAIPEIYPGPLLPQHTVATLTAEGIGVLLDEIQELGLLADIDYDEESLVADASTATVVVRTADATFRHEAYALGFAPGLGADEERSPERTALAAAIERLSDLRSLVGDELGAETPWQPEAYQLFAQPVADLDGFELEPRIVDWPADAGVLLSEATDCVELPRSSIGSLLDDADQLTFFTEGDLTYQVIARPAYPGRTC